mmetsp:Transcript_64456/g.106717  ORF Transcript_64456/g.106717 Transcript_64456/m.106717 type:complete len:210 (-) Transcript_64456:5435-6064(-)
MPTVEPAAPANTKLVTVLRTNVFRWISVPPLVSVKVRESCDHHREGRLSLPSAMTISSVGVLGTTVKMQFMSAGYLPDPPSVKCENSRRGRVGSNGMVWLLQTTVPQSSPDTSNPGSVLHWHPVAVHVPNAPRLFCALQLFGHASCAQTSPIQPFSHSQPLSKLQTPWPEQPPSTHLPTWTLKRMPPNCVAVVVHLIFWSTSNASTSFG